MHKVSADLFQCNSRHYIVLVDRFSGYPFVKALNSLTTASVIGAIHPWFEDFGYPASIRTDGGPQFRSEFAAYCIKHGITHETSSPYHPESNGHAESAVKNVKHLLLKVTPKDFQHAFSVWKNTRKNDKPSPNELFLGRQIRIDLPVMPSLLKTSSGTDHKPPESTPTPVKLRPLRPLTVGQAVWIQNEKTKKVGH